jgi:hypothetical protein
MNDQEGKLENEVIKEIMENMLWYEVRNAAKTNPVLEKILDRAIMIYRLSEKHND